MSHDVVVERPQRGVGESLVILLDFSCGELDRYEIEAVVLKWLQLFIGSTVPANPGSTVATHDRFERRN